MMESTKGISVSCSKHAVYVRVVGRGTFQNGQPLRRYSLERIEQGCGEFFVDLGKCDGMDSTFLGVLAGIGLRLQQNGRAGKLHVISVSSRNLELLQTLGLDRLFGVGEPPTELRDAQPPAEAEFKRLPDSDVTALTKPLNKNDTADLMLEAHDNLVRADQRNAPRFRDLRKFLRESVDKPKSSD